MKKLLIVVIVLAVLIGAFFLFSGRIMVGDEIETLMRNLEEKTKIDFSGIRPDEFQWNIQKKEIINSVLISGRSFEAEEISVSDYEKIESFFEENGFDLDIYNIADGTVSGLVGYRLNSIACVVNSGLAEHKEDKYNVTVKCGSIEGLEPDLSLSAETGLEVNAGESFSISLKSNPSTGYRWEGMYDGEYIEFTDKDYVASSMKLGSGGEDTFTFNALKTGQTEINFYYIRSGEDEPIDQAVYQVNIK